MGKLDNKLAFHSPAARGGGESTAQMCDAARPSRRALIASMGDWFVVATLLPMLQFPKAFAEQVSADDPRIVAEKPTIATQEKALQCYLARPASANEKRAAIIVLHDYWGMRPHFQDIARRAAAEGFVALAPDYASRFGGTPDERDPAREMVDMEEWPYMIADTQAAMQWLKQRDDTNGKLAIVGFGWGGSAVGHLATAVHDGLDAGVVFYGKAPPIEDVPAIKIPLLLNYAGDDPFVDPEVPAFVDALRKAGTVYEIFSYPGVKRAFDDDSGSANYAADAANLAWSRTVDFLHRTLA
jgi:carboxymethylenebutenolidase